MKSISQHILEKLKVSSNAIDEIPFEELTFALYKYCNNTRVDHFNIRLLRSFNNVSTYDYPYFEKPMITKSGKEIKDIHGYIVGLTVESDHKTGELTLIVYYLRNNYDVSPSICRIERDRYDCITDWVKPEVLKEIYDYLIKYA
jgi:hypothetical protein